MIDIDNYSGLLLWYGDWCEPSKRFKPLLERVVEQFGLKLLSETVDNSSDIAYRMGIRATPTLCVLSNGKELSRKVGALSEETLMDFLAKKII